MWKLPGGLVDEGEVISQAAEREVTDYTVLNKNIGS